jgi:hypothetical protein
VTDELPGGRVNLVRRLGATVIRRTTPNSDFVHRLLRYLAAQHWDGAPRMIGIDDGTEVLSFVDGEVPWQEPTPRWAVTDAALAEVARLVRALHDLTAGSELAGGAEVVCHHDLSPSNTVYRDVDGHLRPVAFVDWDLAGPGRRVEDVAHVCWQWLDLGPRVTDIDDAARKITLICDAYGLQDRTELLPTVLWWQERCWNGIEAAARQGNAAMRQLVDNGVSTAIKDAESWTRACGDRLAPAPAAMRRGDRDAG